MWINHGVLGQTICILEVGVIPLGPKAPHRDGVKLFICRDCSRIKSPHFSKCVPIYLGTIEKVLSSLGVYQYA
jgi:hypothetical protein